jgi:predicted nucleotidyltransferase
MVSMIETILGALNEAGVRYLVVGGVAVVLHGHLRTTADLDLVVQLQPDNALRAVQVLGQLGYRPRAPIDAAGFADAATRQAWIRDKHLQVLSFWSATHPELEVDLFVTEPFDFEAVHRRGLRVQLDHAETTIPSIEDLIALKRAVDRTRDREDIAALEALLALRKQGGQRGP